MPYPVAAARGKGSSRGPSSLLTSLVAYWKLDEASGNRADSAGANTLTDNNTVLAGTGKLGNGADFEADASESLSITDNAALSMGDIDFTIAVWVKLESKATTQGIVTKYNSTGSQREYYLRYETGPDRFIFRVSNDGTATVPVTADNLGAVSTGVWYFIVCWHAAAANTINIQVNNGTANSVAHTTGVLDGTSVFFLGSREAVGTDLLDGLLDEVGVWKKVLTAAERTALYNGGAGLTHPFLGA